MKKTFLAPLNFPTSVFPSLIRHCLMRNICARVGNNEKKRTISATSSFAILSCQPRPWRLLFDRCRKLGAVPGRIVGEGGGEAGSPPPVLFDLAHFFGNAWP